jgi:hypothetical protein
VARRPAARPAARGGDIVPATRQARAALIVGGAAVLLAAAAAAGTALAASDGAAGLAAALIGTPAVLLLAAALVLRAPVLVAPSVALLGAAYAVGRVVDGGAVDLHAPLLGAALLLGCELAYWSHELRTTSPDEPGALHRRVAWLAVLGVCAYLAGLALLALADLVRVEGIAVETLGVLAAAGMVAGAIVLASSRKAGSG